MYSEGRFSRNSRCFPHHLCRCCRYLVGGVVTAGFPVHCHADDSLQGSGDNRGQDGLTIDGWAGVAAGFTPFGINIVVLGGINVINELLINYSN